MATKTLGLTGRDYSTLAAWATYVNALSLAANEILEVYNDSGAVADTGAVTVGGWTANGFSVTMRPATGQGIKDNANKLTNALRWNASNGAALTNNVGYTHPYTFNGANLTIQDLQFRATASTASSTARIENSVTVNRCIIDRTAGSGYIIVQGSSGFTLNDCLLMHANGPGIQALATGLALNNCTLVSIGGTGTGIAQPYAVAPVVKNTVVYNFATDFAGTAGSGTTNNATSKATFGGTSWGTSGQTSVTSADFENVSSGTEDLRIKAGSAKLINTGAASVGSGADVVNTTRTGTRDIGAWEAGGSGPSISSQPSNQTVTAGATASFGVTATSSGGALTYQWQRSTNSGGSWANVTTGTGGTSASYTTAATTVSGGSANNGDQYKCTVTDSNGSIDTSAASLTVNAAAATGYSMTGPSSGVVGSASSNFTVTLTPAGGTASATTITPSSGGGGGTFTPTTVSLSTGTPSATFTYTPASAGVKTISVTNSGTLTNPSNISFTASTASSKGGAVLSLLIGKVL